MALVWVAAILALFYLWRKHHFSLFKRLGIPGPEPSLIWGNIPELNRKGALASFGDWTAQYGDPVGYFNGSIPYVIVKDPDLLRQIQIKDFGTFRSRGVTSTLSLYHGSFRNSLFNVPPERWKATRSLLTPTFTSGKMRRMCALLNACTDDFLAVLEGKVGTAFDVYDDFQRLAMDVVARAAFGVDLGFQKGVPGSPEENLLHTAKETVKPSVLPGIRLLMNSFSELGFLWRPFVYLFGWAFKQPGEFLAEHLDSIVEFRKADPAAGRREDLLQLMLDASVDHDAPVEEASLAAGEEEHSRGDSRAEGGERRYMSREEIRANAVAFLIAGFETTSTALVFTTYLLAKFQEVQDRLRAEISQALEERGTLDYDAILGLKYLDQVLCESLRFYPPVVGFITRTAEADYSRGSFYLPKGVAVVVPTYQLHHDPRLWPEPEKFDPDRFGPEKRWDPVAYQPFGNGPRNCVGMRFAQLEAKMTLAKMLARYRIRLAEHQGPLKLASTSILAYPKGGVWIRLERLA